MRNHDDTSGGQSRRGLVERIVPLADLVLIGTLILGVTQLGFALQLHRQLFFKILFAAMVLFSAAARWFTPPTVRVNAALLLVPMIGGLLAYQTYNSLRRPRDGTAAWLAGRPFDSRTLWENVGRERRNTPTAVSYMIPRALLTHHFVLEPWEPESVTWAIRKDWGIVVDGIQTLPLAGVSSRRTVFCNESGTPIVYESDEHGFNNPRGIWTSGDVQVVILGDSFSQGACVAPEATTAAHIRAEYPRTLNLGMSGNGPLMEYATLKEFVVDLRPSIVLWVYYVNDLSDLEVEKNAEVLRRYLEEDNFRQGLAAKQAQIDEVLAAYIEDVAARTPPRWPASMEAAWATRDTTPLWLQDLVTREQHSSIASFLRLDGFTWYVAKRFLEKDTLAESSDYDLFARILGDARDTVAAWGGQLYFVYLPALHYLDGRHPEVPGREPLLALVSRLGIPSIDIHQRFLAQPDPELLRFHYESHANEAGYALHAKTILEALGRSKSPSR